MITKQYLYYFEEDVFMKIRNEINQTYIIIEQPTPILNADYYLTNEKGTLKNYTGNVKVSLLNNIDINNNDLIGLQNLLEAGVKIK